LGHDLTRFVAQLQGLRQIAQFLAQNFVESDLGQEIPWSKKVGGKASVP
jgi:hypothetical protein